MMHGSISQFPSFPQTSSSYRDRTAELLSIAERLRKSQGGSTNGEISQGGKAQDRNSSVPSAGIIPAGAQSEFNRRASRIGLSIHQTSQKLQKLAKLAKRTSMFDDPAVEIQELTAVIKQDITALNAAIADLQMLCESQTDSSGRNRHTSEHSTTVVDNLKSRLMSTTKEFKDVLTMRTENLKVHENRRQLFSSGSAAAVSLPSPSNLRSRPMSNNPPPWAASSTSSSTSSAAQLFSSPQSRHPFESNQYQGQSQQLLPIQDSYIASRTEALQNVETTIVELSNIFKDLATMVAQQGEMAIRIDQDVDDTLANVEGAQGALLKYLNNISSNRWLIIKIFFVLIVFSLIFVIFVA